MEANYTIEQCLDAAREELLRQEPDDKKFMPLVQHWVDRVYGQPAPHENAWHQGLCVWRMNRARASMLHSDTPDPRAYIGVAVMAAQQFVQLHIDELGKVSVELANHARMILTALNRSDAIDPVYLGMLVEGFAWSVTSAGAEGDAVAGFKVRAGGRKGVAAAAADNPDAPSDQKLYAAFVKARPDCDSPRAAHLAVAKQFGLPMPPSDAGRKRVMRAVKKLCPK